MNGWREGPWDDEPAWVYEITWEWEPLPGQRYPGDPGRRKAVHTPVYEASRGDDRATGSSRPAAEGPGVEENPAGYAARSTPVPPQQRDEPSWNRPMQMHDHLSEDRSQQGPLPSRGGRPPEGRAVAPDQRRGSAPPFGRGEGRPGAVPQPTAGYAPGRQPEPGQYRDPAREPHRDGRGPEQHRDARGPDQRDSRGPDQHRDTRSLDQRDSRGPDQHRDTRSPDQRDSRSPDLHREGRGLEQHRGGPEQHREGRPAAGSNPAQFRPGLPLPGRAAAGPSGRPGVAPAAPGSPVSPAPPGVYGAARGDSGGYYGRRHAPEGQGFSAPAAGSGAGDRTAPEGPGQQGDARPTSGARPPRGTWLAPETRPGAEARQVDGPRPVSPEPPSVYGNARPAPANAFPAYPDRPAPGQRDGHGSDTPFDLRPAPPDRGTPAPARPAPQPTRMTPARPATAPAPVYPNVPGRAAPGAGPARPVSPPAAGQVRPVSAPSAGQIRPVSPPSAGQVRPISAPSADQVRPVSPPGASQVRPVSPPGAGPLRPVSAPGAGPVRPVSPPPGASQVRPISAPSAGPVHPVSPPGAGPLRPVSAPGASPVHPVSPPPGTGQIRPISAPGAGPIHPVSAPGAGPLRPVSPPGSGPLRPVSPPGSGPLRPVSPAGGPLRPVSPAGGGPLRPVSAPSAPPEPPTATRPTSGPARPGDANHPTSGPGEDTGDLSGHARPASRWPQMGSAAAHFGESRARHASRPAAGHDEDRRERLRPEPTMPIKAASALGSENDSPEPVTAPPYTGPESAADQPVSGASAPDAFRLPDGPTAGSGVAPVSGPATTSPESEMNWADSVWARTGGPANPLPVVAERPTSEETAPAAEEEEPRGLGWLLSQSGLGAPTVVPLEPTETSPEPLDSTASPEHTEPVAEPQPTGQAEATEQPFTEQPFTESAGEPVAEPADELVADVEADEPMAAVEEDTRPVSAAPETQDWFVPTGEQPIIRPAATTAPPTEDEGFDAADAVDDNGMDDEFARPALRVEAQLGSLTEAHADEPVDAEIVDVEPVHTRDELVDDAVEETDPAAADHDPRPILPAPLEAPRQLFSQPTEPPSAEDPAHEAEATAPEQPSADEPAVDEPAADEPAADEPAADEPAADEADEPTAQHPDEPAADNTDEPTAQHPDEPAADNTDEPTAEHPDGPAAKVADEPRAEQPDEPAANKADEQTADKADEPAADEGPEEQSETTPDEPEAAAETPDEVPQEAETAAEAPPEKPEKPEKPATTRPIPAIPAPIRQRRDGDHPSTRRADPEQVLAAYPWEFDPETLRERIDDDDQMWVVLDRLTDKLEYAERDAVRARLLSLRAVASRLLGDLDAALTDARAALTHAERAGELRQTATVQARLAHVLQWRGEYAEADRLYAKAGSPELPSRLRAEIHELAGRSAFEQGRYLEAMNHFEVALDSRNGADPDLVERLELALDTITARTTDGWGPYPRTSDQILGRTEPPRPLRDERSGFWGYPGAVPPRYAQAQPFSDGLAWVRRPESPAWELIDESGELVIDASSGYRAAGRFAEGLAWVSRDETGGWYAIDRQNRVIVSGGFEDAGPFRNGLALVRHGGWGAVDRHGRGIVQPRYRAFVTALASGELVDGFTDEGLAVVDAGDRYGVVDRTGQLLVAPVHAAVLIHPEAFLIADKYALWGALDRNGEPMIELKYKDRQDVLDEIDRRQTDTRPVL